MKVAYFVGSYRRFTGSQRSLHVLVGALRDRIDPLIVFPGEGEATRAFRELGVPVVVAPVPTAADAFGGSLLRAPFSRRALVAARLLPFTLRLARHLREAGVDLLHTNDPRGHLLAAPAARLARIPIVAHVRGSLRVIGPLYTHALARLADRLVFVADAIRDSVPARYAAKFRTVHNGVTALPPSTRDRSALGLRGDAVVVAVVGSLVPFKGAHHAIEALRRLADPRIALVFVGDAPDPAYGASLARAAEGLDVRFAGWDPAPEDWFRAADIVLLPTVEREIHAGRTVVHSEGLSRTVLEAMSCGRAVVATRVAGAAEQLRDGESGLLVPPSDPEAIAVALRSLLDPTLRHRLGAAAAQRVAERFSVEQAVRGTLAVYAELVTT